MFSDCTGEVTQWLSFLLSRIPFQFIILNKKTGPNPLIFKAFRPVINITCAPVLDNSKAFSIPSALIFIRLLIKANCILFGFNL